MLIEPLYCTLISISHFVTLLVELYNAPYVVRTLFVIV